MNNTSICIAIHNGEKHLLEQLTSFSNQTILPDEIVACFDNCSDKSLNIFNEWKYKNPHLNIKNYLVTFNSHVLTFNYCLNKTRNNFIFLSDQDDVWSNDKIEVCLEIMQKDNHSVLIHDAIVTDENLKHLKSFFLPSYVLNNNWKNEKIKIFNFGKLKFYGCMMVLNKKKLNKFLPIPNLVESHDRWFGYAGYYFDDIYFLNKKLIKYRRHQGATSHSNGVDLATNKSNYSFFNKLKRAIILHILYLKRI